MTVELEATPASTGRPFPVVRTKNASWGRFAKWIVAAEWLALIAGAAYLCGRTLPHAWQKLNTDFPNYYITARLLREGYNTDRLYEWTWLQRQKDHLEIDQPLVGFAPNPPFAAFAVLPLTYWRPLTAKHIWIALNLALLVAIASLLHPLTSLAWRRIALLMALSFPLHRNLLYGQYYILLLLVFTLSLWFYVHQKRALAGLLLGIGFGLKIFPAFFLLYFLRKKDFKAAGSLVIGSVATILISLAAFGFELNRTYFLRVLPWALRGEDKDPYNLAANSLSALLHHLLIFEPEWNLHPLLHAPALLAVLQPLLQLLLLSPAILLVTPRDTHSRKVQIEWAAYIISLLAISTMPASYHFVLLILPVAIMAAFLIEDKRFMSLAVLLALYLGVGFPLWRNDFGGDLSFLAAPRLYLTILLCLFACVLLRRQQQSALQYQQDRRVWSGVLACALVLEVAATLHHQRGIYDPTSERLLTFPAVFLATEPVSHSGSTLFISTLRDGYHAAQRTDDSVQVGNNGIDQLALTAAEGKLWVEESSHKSRIVSVRPDFSGERLEVENAEFPVASPDGKWLAYLRSEGGRSRIWLRALRSGAVNDKPITPPRLNVLEMSFFADDSIIVAAAEDHHAPHLFLTDGHDRLRQIIAEEARYPAVSPDGQWLAYARQSRGVWNLWLRNMHTGQEKRVTSADCNDIFPSWETDSRTLIFASDCGRALGLTALYRRHVIP